MATGGAGPWTARPRPRRGIGRCPSAARAQRSGGRGGSEPGRGGSASDPAGTGGRGFRPRRCGRSVRSADAGGDTAVAVVSRWAVDGVSGRCVGRSAAVCRCRRSSSGGDRGVCACSSPRGAAVFAGERAGFLARGQRGVGGLVLAVMNSTNPAEFEAYLRRFPNGLFSESAQARVAALPRTAGRATAVLCCAAVTGAAVPRTSGLARASGAPPPSGTTSSVFAFLSAELRAGYVAPRAATSPSRFASPSGG